MHLAKPMSRGQGDWGLSVIFESDPLRHEQMPWSLKCQRHLYVIGNSERLR